MYKTIIRPVLFSVDPECIHDIAEFALSTPLFTPAWSLWNMLNHTSYPQLKTSFCGVNCEHPIGLAAGFDKNATMFPRLHHLGFSHIEVGTVTGESQPGNPKKRLFRLPEDQALINRMGFNNHGAVAAAQHLKRGKSPIPIGGNIGKTKKVPLDQAVSDYERSFLAIKDHIDYLVVNVSSPNTPNLRTLQDKEPLCELLGRLNELKGSSDLPILLKIAPDLSEYQLEEIVGVVVDTGIPGVIATNTTIGRTDLKASPAKIEEIGAGGLSGTPVFEKSTEILRFLRRHLPADVDLIGVGGIMNGQDVYTKLKAGACAVQIYTGFIYKGPAGVFQMLKELAALMKRDGVRTVSEIIGSDI